MTFLLPRIASRSLARRQLISSGLLNTKVVSIQPFSHVLKPTVGTVRSFSLRDRIESRKAQTDGTVTLQRSSGITLPKEADEATYIKLTTETSVNALAHVLKTSLFGTSEKPHLPTEGQLVSALTACQRLANYQASQTQEGTGSEGEDIIRRLEGGSKPVSKTTKSTTPTSTAPGISQLARDVLLNPYTFITPAVLEAYVSLQISIGALDYIPESFDLYRTKPVLEKVGSKPHTPSETSFKQAIPERIANQALDAAIKKKDIYLCLDLIHSSHAQTAYRRARLIKKASPFFAAVTLAPFGAWTIAKGLSRYYEYDPELAAKYAFVGILTYVGFTGSLGLLALLTFNDQMKRVTWVPGTPLHKRWLAEEERAALDKVAIAWGFKEEWKRGFEEGEDWMVLKDWINGRGMILDDHKLLEGMK
ncbi:hypothetical protein BJ508DRAFT_418559 [Ascobolus immersus RN42]|uniref:Uncharacterized protein n=1 Tax=Ascobolus immersus RN42 TaxID=1160509 RepID=A0A3N4HPW5_ASCIM|nr:hypothetical protein BJ508DRAFT_418559 [Ascobolus immersus RN42]